MAYFDGFVVPVPAEKKAEYRDAAAKVEAMFREFGAVRHLEAWEDDVPDGTRTDFRRAVQAQPGEFVVLSWIEYPDKATRDAANARMMSDERMQSIGDMPFDGKRMIYGGFAVAAGDPPVRGSSYVDGALLPVAVDRRSAIVAAEEAASAMIREHGALRIVQGWGDDVPDGKQTDFRRAVAAGEGETVAFQWIEWPDKATRNAAWGKLMRDPRMHGLERPYDGARRVHGGFVPIFDWSAQ